MNYRVYVERSVQRFGLTVWLQEWDGNGHVLLTHDGRRVPVNEASSYPEPDNYFARIPPGAEHALLGELARTLGAVEHPEQLRRDFDHIRARHDLLVDNLMQRRSR